MTCSWFFPCVQYAHTTVVGLATKILSRKHMELTQFNFGFQIFPKRIKPMNDHERHLSLLFEGNASSWGAMTDVAYKLKSPSIVHWAPAPTRAWTNPHTAFSSLVRTYICNNSHINESLYASSVWNAWRRGVFCNPLKQAIWRVLLMLCRSETECRNWPSLSSAPFYFSIRFHPICVNDQIQHHERFKKSLSESVQYAVSYLNWYLINTLVEVLKCFINETSARLSFF